MANNNIRQILQNPKCLSFLDISSPQINLVDNSNGKCYNIVPEIHEQLICILDQIYQAEDGKIIIQDNVTDELFGLEQSFSERLLTSIAGFNWRLSGMTTYDTRMFYELSSILFIELGKLLNPMPTTLHFFLRSDEIIIPELRMYPRQREFITLQLNSILPNILKELHISIDDNVKILNYMYINKLSPMGYFGAVNRVTYRNGKDPMVESIPPDKYHITDLSMILVKGTNIKAMMTDLRTELQEMLNYTSFSTTTLDDQTIIGENMRNSLSIADVRYFYEMLQKIPDEVLYSNKFWTLMTPLACSGSLFDELSKDGYKHLVRFHYNKLCEIRDVLYDKNEFEYAWENASNQQSHKIELIHYMRRAHENEYNIIHHRFIIAKIKEMSTFSYNLPDGDLAKLLYYCICHKYGTGMNEYKGGSVITNSAQEWYKFIEPSDEHENGELYKWKKLSATPDLYTFISIRIVPYFNALLSELGLGNTNITTNGRTVRNIRVQEIQKTIRSINTISTQRNILSSVQNYLSRQYFFKRMDKNPWVIGVSNGILELASPTISTNDEYEEESGRQKARLVQGYHNYPISKFIPITFRDDCTTYMVRKVATHLHDYFYEKDVVDWHCYYWCRALDSFPKDPIALLWIADGSRAKTFWQQLLLNSIGMYGKKASNRIIVQTQTTTATRTELAALEGYNLAAFSEITPNDVLDDQKLKMLLGVEDQSLNDKNEKERIYHFALILWGAMNHDLKVTTTDHGTWRRLKYYSPKLIYVDNPDINNKYHRKDNPNYVNKYATDPQWHEAFITILLHYHSILMNKYKGSLKNVPASPTIENETLEYRGKQDLIHRFCCQRLVVVDNIKELKEGDECDMVTFVKYYSNWYKTMGHGNIVPVNGAIERFKASVLAPYIVDITDTNSTSTKMRGTSWIIGVRDITVAHSHRQVGVISDDEKSLVEKIGQKYTYVGHGEDAGDSQLMNIIRNAKEKPDVRTKKLVGFKMTGLF
jgi:hypothetical protein